MSPKPSLLEAGGRQVVLDKRRQIDGEFGVRPRNEIEPLAVVQIPRVGPSWGDLADKIRTRHLNEPGECGDDGHSPGRLFGLRGGGAGLPLVEESAWSGAWGAALRVQTGCCQQEEQGKGKLSHVGLLSMKGASETGNHR